MARRGRPRKLGKRKPCGRLSDSEQKRVDVRAVVFEQPHRRWLKDAHRRDQRAESEIGRLHLAGKISEAKYWAADRWRSIVMQFHIVLATPMPTGTALGRVVSAGVDDDDDAWKRGESGKNERAETEVEMRARVLSQLDGAKKAIGRLDDAQLVFAAMERVIIRDLPCSERDLMRIERGLSQLCRRWKMTDPKAGDDLPVRVVGSDQERGVWMHDEKEVRIVYADG